LCDECVEGFLLGGELRGERLLLGKGVIKWVAANGSSLRKAEANDEEGDSEQDAESGAPGALLLRRRVLHV
jgi:hypothetical protein